MYDSWSVIVCVHMRCRRLKPPGDFRLKAELRRTRTGYARYPFWGRRVAEFCFSVGRVRRPRPQVAAGPDAQENIAAPGRGLPKLYQATATPEIGKADRWTDAQHLSECRRPGAAVVGRSLVRPTTLQKMSAPRQGAAYQTTCTTAARLSLGCAAVSAAL